MLRTKQPKLSQKVKTLILGAVDSSGFIIYHVIINQWTTYREDITSPCTTVCSAEMLKMLHVVHTLPNLSFYKLFFFKSHKLHDHSISKWVKKKERKKKS